MSRWLLTLTLCFGLLAAVPAASFSSGGGTGGAAAKPKCKKAKKGKKKAKKCTPAKKKKVTPPAPSGVPADGSYAGTGGVKITVSTTAGKRVVQASLTVQATCDLTGTSAPVPAGVQGMPLVGTSFTGVGGKSPLAGQATISGTFESATRVHLNVKVVDANAAPGVVCGGTADITTDLQPA